MKIHKNYWQGGDVVEHLPSRQGALASSPSTVYPSMMVPLILITLEWWRQGDQEFKSSSTMYRI